MNNKVFNELKAPLYIVSHTSVAESIFGNLFQATSGVLTSGGSSQQMVMTLSNPPGSGIRAVIDTLEVSVSTGGVLALMTLRLDGTASGVLAVTGYNLNTDITRSPVCTAAANGGAGVSITGGKIFHTDFVDVDDDHSPVAVVVTPGHSLGINYVFSTNGNQGAMQIRWYEISLNDGFV